MSKANLSVCSISLSVTVTFTYDANGNISEYLSAADVSVAAHYDYSPFGETLVASGPLASSFTHRFSTKPYCQTTGFCEYQMRKYRPDIGRWMSRDPTEEKGGVNLYAFVNNNSLHGYDKFGLNVDLSGFVNLGALHVGSYDDAYNNSGGRGSGPGGTYGFTLAYITVEWDIEECGNCGYKLVIKEDVAVKGSMAWRKFLDSYNDREYVYADHLNYKGRSERTVGDHELLHYKHALYLARQLDTELHIVADGKCVSKSCAFKKSLYLWAVNKYYRSVREYDDAQIDYEDYPDSDMNTLLQAVFGKRNEIEQNFATMDQAKSEMEAACQ